MGSETVLAQLPEALHQGRQKMIKKRNRKLMAARYVLQNHLKINKFAASLQPFDGPVSAQRTVSTPRPACQCEETAMMPGPFPPKTADDVLSRIPAVAGTYAMLLGCRRAGLILIGRAGRLKRRPGVYVYVGSAHGPGGLRARLGHHLRLSISPRWHVDYLRRVTTPLAVWTTVDPIRREHQWAAIMSGIRGATLPMPGFGASDCRCRAHLFHFDCMPGLSTFRKKARQHFPCHGPIRETVLTARSGGRPQEGTHRSAGCTFWVASPKALL